MTTPHRLPDGYRLEEFRFESCIGGGGFGLVYAATDTALRRRLEPPAGERPRRASQRQHAGRALR